MSGVEALIVVDLQKDFCPGGALAVPNGDSVVPVINQLIPLFPIVVATKDWHPEDSKHFESWPLHCIRDSTGAAFHDELNTEGIDKVFLKGTGAQDDGYSGFEATNEDLETYLKGRGVGSVFVVGLAADYCVKATAVEAVQRGFETSVVVEATAGVNVNEGDTEAALAEMQGKGVALVHLEDLTEGI